METRSGTSVIYRDVREPDDLFAPLGLKVLGFVRSPFERRLAVPTSSGSTWSARSGPRRARARHGRARADTGVHGRSPSRGAHALALSGPRTE
ncbi:MAG TPA: hypothetical protein VF794_29150 [Archangium sp.]|uniref:hypothetical protein n=1 Tax=Archangium sp. TaxID=1872627 RepID=UPI002ED8B9AE